MNFGSQNEEWFRRNQELNLQATRRVLNQVALTQALERVRRLEVQQLREAEAAYVRNNPEVADEMAGSSSFISEAFPLYNDTTRARIESAPTPAETPIDSTRTAIHSSPSSSSRSHAA